MRTIKQICILSFLLLAMDVLAQPGILDSTFGVVGYVTTDIGDGQDIAYSVAIQSDEKIIAAGTSKVGIYYEFSLARYNTNGNPDNTFGTNGKVHTAVIPYFHNTAVALKIQPDGKIILAGTSEYSSQHYYSIVRYNVNGSLDTSFGTGGIVLFDLNRSVILQSLALQNDGKIIVAGVAFNNTIPEIGMCRCNIDGSPDTTFGANGIVITHIGDSSTRTQAESVLVQDNGKILIITNTNLTNSDFTILRYSNNGTLDSTFGVNGISFTSILDPFIYYAYDAVLQNDGKIVVVGHFSGSSSQGYSVARFNSDGTLDSLFGTSGLTRTTFTYPAHGYGVALDNNGQIIVVGGSEYQSPNIGFAMAMYNTDGSLDNTFGSFGIVSGNFGSGNPGWSRKAAIQSDNNIVLAGYTLDPHSGIVYGIARYGVTVVVVHEILSDDTFLFYPNPAKDKLTIESRQKATIEILNFQGQTIQQIYIQQGKTDIDISGLAKGLYILRLSSNDRTEVTRFVKE